jgi:hypothetical protein
MMMKLLQIFTFALTTLVIASPAMAESCYDLWFERNAIYDANGFCFSTSLGKRTFDNSDCYTSNPKLSGPERRRIAQIQKAERRMGCRVNN